MQKSDDVDDVANLIIESIQKAVQKSTKISKLKVKHSEKIQDWPSEKLINLMLEKDKLLKRRRKNHGNIKVAEELRIISEKFKKVMRSEFTDFVMKKSTRMIRKNYGEILIKFWADRLQTTSRR